MQRLGPTAAVDIFGFERLPIVACRLVVFLLPIEGITQVVLPAVVGRIAFQRTPIGHFRLVVVLLLILSVALAQLMPVGLSQQSAAYCQEQYCQENSFHNILSKSHLRLRRSNSSTSAKKQSNAAASGYI